MLSSKVETKPQLLAHPQLTTLAALTPMEMAIMPLHLIAHTRVSTNINISNMRKMRSARVGRSNRPQPQEQVEVTVREPQQEPPDRELHPNQLWTRTRYVDHPPFDPANRA